MNIDFYVNPFTCGMLEMAKRNLKILECVKTAMKGLNENYYQIF